MSRTRSTLLSCLTLLVLGCATTDAPPNTEGRPIRRGMREDRAAVAFGVLPPANWWHDPQITSAVRLSNEQILALDDLQRGRGEDIAHLRRDLPLAERDLQTVLSAEQVSTDDILAAGRRMETLRDNVFDQEIRMLAAERALLSAKEWTALQDALRDEQSERRENGSSRRGRDGGPGRGGRGGFPGRPPG